MIKWFKKLLFIVKNYDVDRTFVINRIEKAERIIKDRTDIHADVHYKSGNQIVVIGRYKNRNYIQTFNVSGDDFSGLVDRLKDMERYGHIGRIDAPPQMNAVIENELWRVK